MIDLILRSIRYWIKPIGCKQKNLNQSFHTLRILVNKRSCPVDPATRCSLLLAQSGLEKKDRKALLLGYFTMAKRSHWSDSISPIINSSNWPISNISAPTSPKCCCCSWPYSAYTSAPVSLLSLPSAYWASLFHLIRFNTWTGSKSLHWFNFKSCSTFGIILFFISMKIVNSYWSFLASNLIA